MIGRHGGGNRVAVPFVPLAQTTASTFQYNVFSMTMG
jgi:hypothetical protein